MGGMVWPPRRPKEDGQQEYHSQQGEQDDSFVHVTAGSLTLALSGAGPKTSECKPDAPSRVHSEALVKPLARFHLSGIV
jgi:hypothetical protein